MNCKNCGCELKEVEAPDFAGNVNLILVHKNQDMNILACEEGCICGCIKPEPKKAKKAGK